MNISWRFDGIYFILGIQCWSTEISNIHTLTLRQDVITEQAY